MSALAIMVQESTATYSIMEGSITTINQESHILDAKNLRNHG